MKKATMVVRLLLGLIFVVFGLNGFLNFLPMPTDMPADQMAFFGILMSTKLMYVIKAIEVSCGLMLLANFMPALAIALLSPIVFNIFWFHLMLAHQGLPIAVVLVAGTGYLVFFGYRKAFAGLLSKKL